jgi:HSP20 family protein
MVYRRRYPMGWNWRDLDEMMSEMENRFWGPSGRFLPAGGITDRMMPAIRGEFRVDVREHDDEVIVVADLPGAEKEEGFYVRERMAGSMCRVVTLPHDVNDKGASASFKNGVLEVRLKKSTAERGASIDIK